MNVISPGRPSVTVSAQEMERRREALRRADASNRIEGLFPTPEGTAVFEAYIRGEIEFEDILPRLKALQQKSRSCPITHSETA